MSRSKRRTPIIGMCSRSEKQDKRTCNRKLRRISKSMLRDDCENYQDPKKEEMYDLWNMTKDGKHYFGNTLNKIMEWYKKCMRK